MSKKKNQLRPTMSFEQVVAQASLNRLKPYVSQMVSQESQNIRGAMGQTLRTMFSRLVVMERILMEKFGYSQDDLASLVSNVEDEHEGLVEVSDEVKLNDVVRFEIKTKAVDAVEYQGSSKLRTTKTGTGENLGKEIESNILGMKKGETKEFQINPKKPVDVCVTINKVSRRIEKEQPKPEKTDENKVNGSTSGGGEVEKTGQE